MDPNHNHGASALGLDGAPLDDAGKAMASLRALAAMAGCSLHQLDGGGFLICRWGLTRELPDLRTVSNFLRRLGSAR